MSDQLIEEYISAHISEEPPLLAQTYRETHLHHLYPRMCSGHVQGRLLKMLTAMIRPRRVLELGAFTGYSTLCMAEALEPGAELHTVEIDDELEDELLERFSRAQTAGSITLHLGDVLEVLPTMEGKWDMVFMDARRLHHRRQYPVGRQSGSDASAVRCTDTRNHGVQRHGGKRFPRRSLHCPGARRPDHNKNQGINGRLNQ